MVPARPSLLHGRWDLNLGLVCSKHSCPLSYVPSSKFIIKGCLVFALHPYLHLQIAPACPLSYPRSSEETPLNHTMRHFSSEKVNKLSLFFPCRAMNATMRETGLGILGNKGMKKPLREGFPKREDLQLHLPQIKSTTPSWITL